MEIFNELILTRKFLIRGNIGIRTCRFSRFLDIYTKAFIPVSKAELLDTLSGEKLVTNNFQVRVEEILFAHEFVDTQGDPMGKALHGDVKLLGARMLFAGDQPILLDGLYREGIFEASGLGHRFFVVQDPKITGLPEPIAKEFHAIRDLKYLIVNKEKIAYLFPR